MIFLIVVVIRELGVYVDTKPNLEDPVPRRQLATINKAH